MDDKARDSGYGLARQAGTVLGLGASEDKALEFVDRFFHNIADLQKRWDNRLILENVSLAEAYLHGRLEIVLYGEWLIGGEQANWFCRVTPNHTVGQSGIPALDIDVSDTREGDCGDEQVMFIVVVEVVEPPKRLVRSVFRPYLTEKKVLGTGEGLLHRREDGGGYKVFPRWMHREMFFSRRVDGSNDSGAQVIQCSSEIMDRISDCECKRFWDWLSGEINKTERRLCVGRSSVVFLGDDLIKFRRQGLGKGTQLINVAVGPLNL